MNSCAAICALEAPPAASRAICASCAVRVSCASAARLGACSPLAAVRCAPSGKCCGADRVEGLVRAAQLVTAIADTPLAAQPLAVQQMGVPEFQPQASTAKAAEGLPLAQGGPGNRPELYPGAGISARTHAEIPARKPILARPGPRVVSRRSVVRRSRKAAPGATVSAAGAPRARRPRPARAFGPGWA